MDSHLLRIAGLIKKNSTGDISAREREELLQWKEKYPILQQWIENPDEKQEEIEQRLSQLLAEDILSDWKLIQKKVGQPSKSKKYYGIAAASILILMTLGFWIQNKQWLSKPIEQNLTHKTEEVIPGKNKAVLTLSDGKKVALGEGVSQWVQEGSLELSAKEDKLDYSSQQLTEVYTHRLEVPIGGTYRVRLNDGTQVWLNADSELEFPSVFTGEERVVSVKGEAYFEVAKDSSRPFKVEVNGTVVEALGTAFNVNTHLSPEAVKTILTEGKIRVSADKQQEVINRGYATISSRENILVEEADIEEALAWKDGYFYFNSKNLKDILGEISRWYDVELQLETAISADKYKGGIKRTESIGAVCDILTDLTDYVIEINNRTLIVKKTA